LAFFDGFFADVAFFFPLVAVAFAFIWAGNPLLSMFSWQLTALLMLILLFHNLITNRQLHQNPLNESIIVNRNIANSISLTIVVTLLVISTGGASSALFFLLDFLLIGLSLFFATSTSFGRWPRPRSPRGSRRAGRARG